MKRYAARESTGQWWVMAGRRCVAMCTREADCRQIVNALRQGEAVTRMAVAIADAGRSMCPCYPRCPTGAYCGCVLCHDAIVQFYGEQV